MTDADIAQESQRLNATSSACSTPIARILIGVSASWRAIDDARKRYRLVKVKRWLPDFEQQRAGGIVRIGRDVSLLANQLQVEDFLPCTGTFGY
jgi:hypothetical protein